MRKELFINFVTNFKNYVYYIFPVFIMLISIGYGINTYIVNKLDAEFQRIMRTELVKKQGNRVTYCHFR